MLFHILEPECWDRMLNLLLQIGHWAPLGLEQCRFWTLSSLETHVADESLETNCIHLDLFFHPVTRYICMNVSLCSASWLDADFMILRPTHAVSHWWAPERPGKPRETHLLWLEQMFTKHCPSLEPRRGVVKGGRLIYNHRQLPGHGAKWDVEDNMTAPGTTL